MSDDERNEVVKIFNTLNAVEVRGYNNFCTMATCMDALKRLAEIETKEVDDGNANT